MFNLQLYAAAAGILLLVAGGAYAYHEVVVAKQEIVITDLKEKVGVLTRNNEVLTENVDKAVSANTALQQSLTQYAEQTNKLTALMAEATQRDEQIALWFSEAQAALLSPDERKKMQELFRTDPSSSIDAANRDMDCVLANYGKSGTCRNGAFVPFSGGK